MELRLKTESGEEHGLINTVGNSVQDNDFKHMKPETKEKAKSLKKDDDRMVKARYLNIRGEGETLEKSYCRWAGSPIQTWKFIHDHIYTVPNGLVKEINESCGLAQRSEVLDAKGIPTKKDKAALRIHSFVPISF